MTVGPRARAGAVLLAVFALGALAGVAFERHHSIASVRKSPVEEHAAAMAELRDAVGLEDDQVVAIERVFARHHDVVQRSWEELRPEVQEAMRRVHTEIAELLRPEQRERFHEWLIRRREIDADAHPPPESER